ncbi:hypothetical protein CR513_14294, partial [Mucuna pruriens]
MHVSKPFEYVHSDLWGPSRVTNLGRDSYFLTMIDDFSRIDSNGMKFVSKKHGIKRHRIMARLLNRTT